MRPQAGVGKLKHAPPMRVDDLPVVGQALSPANRIVSQLLTERLIDKPQVSSNRRHHHSAYAVPSRLILSEPLCTSKIPGSDWEILWLASSITIRQL